MDNLKLRRIKTFEELCDAHDTDPNSWVCKNSKELFRLHDMDSLAITDVRRLLQKGLYIVEINTTPDTADNADS